MTSTMNPMQLPITSESSSVGQERRSDWPARFGQENLRKFHSLLSDEARTPHSQQPAGSSVSRNPDWIQSIVRKELELWQDSLVYEIRASRDECLMGLEYLKNIIEKDKQSQTTEVRQPSDAQGSHQLHAPLQSQPVQSALPSVTEHAPGTEEEEENEKDLEQEMDAIKTMEAIELWEISQMDSFLSDQNWLSRAYTRALDPKTNLFQWVLSLPCGMIFPSHRPSNFLVTICDSHVFYAFQGFVILANVVFSGFLADQRVRELLKQPPEKGPHWWETVDVGFTIYFCAEAVFRLLAFRLYFFVAKRNWPWNIFDAVLCTVSVLSSGLNLNILRLLRIFRVMRMMRVIAESTYLVELRNLFFSVMACMIPLFWAVVFLAMTFALFSMIIMQGVGYFLEQHGQYHEHLLDSLRDLYEGFDRCFLTLLACVLGDDWLEPHRILVETSQLNKYVIPVFVIFVNIGVLNIVIGVFASATSQSKDRHAIAVDQMSGVEDFCDDMVTLLQTVSNTGGDIEWEEFKEFFHREEIQAYLAYHGLDTRHIKLIFEMSGDREGRCVSMRALVLSLLRLKGSAKSLDTTILLHGIRRTMADLGDLKYDIKQIKQDVVKQFKQVPI